MKSIDQRENSPQNAVMGNRVARIFGTRPIEVECSTLRWHSIGPAGIAEEPSPVGSHELRSSWSHTLTSAAFGRLSDRRVVYLSACDRDVVYHGGVIGMSIIEWLTS